MPNSEKTRVAAALWRVTRKAATSLTLILVVALGARIAFAWDQASKIPRDALRIAPFQSEAGNIAFALAGGKGFSNVFRTDTGPTAWLAPVYPLLLAGIFKVFGVFTAQAFVAAAASNILFSAAASVPIFYAGKRLWGLGVASGAAWLWAVFPNAILIPFEWVWDTSLAVLLAAAILWATLAVTASASQRDWSGYGLLWGVALLTNPALGSLFPFLLVWAAIRVSVTAAGAWKRAALATGIAALCCSPWAVRNYVAFHRFIPLRSNLPFELWLGNNDIFDEHAVGGRRAITRTEEARRYAQLGESAYMSEKWALAKNFIETHPALEAKLTGRRFLGFWLGTNAPLRNFRATDSWLIRVILLASFLTAIVAAAGVAVLWWRKAPGAFPAAIFPLVFPCLYYFTHADLRYRHPIDPVVMLLTAAAVAGLWDAMNKRPAASSQPPEKN